MLYDALSNVHGNPRLQSPSLTLKALIEPMFLVRNLDMEPNLEFPNIIEHYFASGFFGTCQAFPYRRFKHTVIQMSTCFVMISLRVQPSHSSNVRFYRLPCCLSKFSRFRPALEEDTHMRAGFI